MAWALASELALLTLDDGDLGTGLVVFRVDASVGLGLEEVLPTGASGTPGQKNTRTTIKQLI